MSRPIHFVAVLLVVLFTAGRSLGAVSVQAVLERGNIMAGESTTLQVMVEGGVPQSLGNVESVPNLRLQYLGSSQNIVTVNGQTTARRGLNFQVSAARPGVYTIPPIPVVVDGATYSTQPLQLTVTQSEVTAQNRYAFLRLIVPRTEIYVGEIVPVELQLYVAGRAENLVEPVLESPGFVIHKRAPHQVSSTHIGTTPYSVASFKMAVSAAKAGQLQLGPGEISFSLLVPLQRDPGDAFGTFFGPRYQRREVTLQSPSHSMNVLPLPRQDRPDSFAGAIGDFSWEVAAGPTNLNTGDPITIKAIVTGQGNWDSVKLPPVDWPGFKAYPPSESLQTTDPLGLQGTKIFEQVVVPEHAGLQEIPSVEFSFFEPAEKAYRTLSSPAVPVTIRSSGAPRVQPSLADALDAPEQEPPPPSDIVHIKPNPGTLLAASAPLVRQPWFWALQAVPLLAFVGSVIWRRRQDHLAGNPRLRRKLAVRGLVGQGLHDLSAQADAGDAEAFYAITFRLLQERLGERLDLPAHAITEAVVDDSLPPRGASPDLVARLHKLFQACNQVRYSPHASAGDLHALIPRLETALHEIEGLRG